MKRVLIVLATVCGIVAVLSAQQRTVIWSVTQDATACKAAIQTTADAATVSGSAQCTQIETGVWVVPPPPPPPPPSGTFTQGQAVQTTGAANVRVAPPPTSNPPSNNLAGSQPDGSVGTVVSGPTMAVLGGVDYPWWNIDFGIGVDGWVAQDALEAVAIPPPPGAKQCADGLDNDGDGFIDLTDPGCTDATDDDEVNAVVPPPGTFVLRQATNTGFAGAGIPASALVNQGGITYATAGQVITNKKFTGTVTVTGANVTIDGCWFAFGGGSSTKGLIVKALGVTVKNCTFAPTSGSWYMDVNLQSGSLTLDHVDISKGENNITVDGGSLHLVDSYLHDPSNASNPSGHVDGIEIYGGLNHTLERSTIINNVSDTVSPINVAPWSGGAKVDNLVIQENYIDGGNRHILVDNQASGITRTKIVKNRLGGHTFNFGTYAALDNHDGRAIVATDAALAANIQAIEWADNVWYYCVNNIFPKLTNLSPDKTGQTVVP